ncbi:hypothetical protein ACJJTC_014713 [Scirpophaga incertulas]
MVWLLGDSGYPQRPWLMTPILDAVPESEEDRYNKRHRKARVIILACSVLHNLCINHSLIDSDEENDHEIEDTENLNSDSEVAILEATSELIRGRQVRQQLVRRLQ